MKSSMALLTLALSVVFSSNLCAQAPIPPEGNCPLSPQIFVEAPVLEGTVPGGDKNVNTSELLDVMSNGSPDFIPAWQAGLHHVDVVVRNPRTNMKQRHRGATTAARLGQAWHILQTLTAESLVSEFLRKSKFPWDGQALNGSPGAQILCNRGKEVVALTTTEFAAYLTLARDNRCHSSKKNALTSAKNRAGSSIHSTCPLFT